MTPSAPPSSPSLPASPSSPASTPATVASATGGTASPRAGSDASASNWQTHRQRYVTAAVHVGLVVLMLLAVSLTLGRSPRGAAMASGDLPRSTTIDQPAPTTEPAPERADRATPPASAAEPDALAVSSDAAGRTPTPLGRRVTPPPARAVSSPPILAAAMPLPRTTVTITDDLAASRDTKEMAEDLESPELHNPGSAPVGQSQQTLADASTSNPATAPAASSTAVAQVRALAAEMSRPQQLSAPPAAADDRMVRQALPYMRDPHAAVGGVYGSPGATRVVYLVDASGSMIDTLPFVLTRLQHAVRTLRPAQTFTVMFCSGQGVTELPPLGMKRVSPDVTRAAARWLDPLAGRVLASGRADAHAAVRRALAYQPDAIVLLTDGLAGRLAPDPEHRAALLELADRHNPCRTTFHTVQLRRPDPSAFPGQPGVLESLARLTAGTHRYVPDSKLNP